MILCNVPILYLCTCAVKICSISQLNLRLFIVLCLLSNRYACLSATCFNIMHKSLFVAMMFVLIMHTRSIIMPRGVAARGIR